VTNVSAGGNRRCDGRYGGAVGHELESADFVRQTYFAVVEEIPLCTDLWLEGSVDGQVCLCRSETGMRHAASDWYEAAKAH
jgi:hypothetical protein